MNILSVLGELFVPRVSYPRLDIPFYATKGLDLGFYLEEFDPFGLFFLRILGISS
jgi:hypothetical protein